MTEPWLLLACDDGIELADLNGDELQTWNEAGEGEGAFFGYDGRTIYSVRADYTARVYTPGESREVPVELGPHDSKVVAADRHPSGLFATAVQSGTVTVFDSHQTVIRTMRIDGGRIQRIRFSADGNTLYARTWEPKFYRWTLSGDAALNMYDWIDPISDEDWAALTE